MDVIINYTYIQLKPLELYQKTLLYYSILKSLQIGRVIFHCDKSFVKVLLSFELDIDIKIIEPLDVNYTTYWAASKIDVYNRTPVGQIHLDIDAVLKECPEFKNDLQIAYFDKVEIKPTIFELDKNYTLPENIYPDTDGFNMSCVIFHSQELKDKYCNMALDFMYKNPIIDRTWKTMVFVEQALLYQLSKDYSYNYISNDTNYYHLGASKNFLGNIDKLNLINKINDRIKNEFPNKILCEECNYECCI